jgi:hypothetical protein
MHIELQKLTIYILLGIILLFSALDGPQSGSLTRGFDHRNWNRDVIHLRYETQHVHSEWEELFLFQKPFAVRFPSIMPFCSFQSIH